MKKLVSNISKAAAAVGIVSVVSLITALLVVASWVVLYLVSASLLAALLFAINAALYWCGGIHFLGVWKTFYLALALEGVRELLRVIFA